MTRWWTIPTHSEWLASLRQRQHIVSPQNNNDADIAVRIVDAGFRSLAKEMHPDAGGDHKQMLDLIAARDALRQGIA